MNIHKKIKLEFDKLSPLAKVFLRINEEFQKLEDMNAILKYLQEEVKRCGN